MWLPDTHHGISRSELPLAAQLKQQDAAHPLFVRHDALCVTATVRKLSEPIGTVSQVGSSVFHCCLDFHFIHNWLPSMAYLGALSALLAATVTAQYPEGSLYTPRITPGTGNWSSAYAKAHAFVCNLTLTEKVNLTTQTGTGASYGYSLGIIPRVGFRGLALDDSPTGVRSTDYSSAFTAPLNMAMTWDRDLIYAQAYANGAEHKAKGVNVAYSPVVGPLGRSPEGGRNWEGSSPDPYLSGVAFGLTVAGMNAGGTIAVGKHFVLYEQEHFR